MLTASSCRRRNVPLIRMGYEANSSSNAFASFRSSVLWPSVNHPYTEASSSRAFCTLPWSRRSRARLYACAFERSCSGESNAISPATRLISVWHHISPLASIIAVASSMRRPALTNWLISV